VIQDLAYWLFQTPLSDWLARTPSIVPLVQSIHILAIAVVMASMLFINLRMLGWAGPRGGINADLRRFVPAIWGALVVLLATGLIMVAAEPVRELMNLLFRIKIVLVTIAAISYYIVQHKSKLDSGYWESHRKIAVLFAIGSFILWIVIATLGRWIAFAGSLV